jgi:hypothetical protein
MSPRTSVGLVAAGAAARTALARLLPGVLGPVMGESYRLASRMVSALRAGYPVRDAEGLRRCRTVLIAVPDAVLAPFVERLAAAQVRWAGKVVLLCDSPLTSAALSRLAEKGARAGSIAELPGFDPARFLIEGDRAAMRAARRLIGGRLHAIEVKPEGKTRLLAAYAIAGDLFIPLATAVQACVRAAGLRGEPASSLLEHIFSRALRAFLKSGRQGSSGILAAPDAAEVSRRAEVLGQIDPKLAEYFRGAAANALRLFGKEDFGLHGLEKG